MRPPNNGTSGQRAFSKCQGGPGTAYLSIAKFIAPPITERIIGITGLLGKGRAHRTVSLPSIKIILIHVEKNVAIELDRPQLEKVSVKIDDFKL